MTLSTHEISDEVHIPPRSLIIFYTGVKSLGEFWINSALMLLIALFKVLMKILSGIDSFSAMLLPFYRWYRAIAAQILQLPGMANVGM